MRRAGARNPRRESSEHVDAVGITDVAIILSSRLDLLLPSRQQLVQVDAVRCLRVRFGKIQRFEPSNPMRQVVVLERNKHGLESLFGLPLRGYEGKLSAYARLR